MGSWEIDSLTQDQSSSASLSKTGTHTEGWIAEYEQPVESGFTSGQEVENMVEFVCDEMAYFIGCSKSRWCRRAAVERCLLFIQQTII